MSKIGIGDIVRKVHGKRLAEVVQIHDQRMSVRWLHNNITNSWQYIGEYVVATDEEINATKGVTGVELYEVETENGTKIATKLMEKSKDTWIMEVKGSGEVVVVSKDKIKEIVKYTIEVKFNTGKITNYEATEGQYKLDEVFLMGNTLDIARVIKLDSKCKSANSEFKPFAKLVLEL